MAKKKSGTETATKYHVHGRVKHQGEIYSKGESITLLPSEASDLVASGHLVLAKVASPASASIAPGDAAITPGSEPEAEDAID